MVLIHSSAIHNTLLFNFKYMRFLRNLQKYDAKYTL